MVKRNTKTGKRKDIPHYVRSSWEANYARYLRHTGIPYEYEPKTFYFNTWERRGAMHYTPDFYLPEEDRYVEIKGRMDSEDRTKLKRMAKYYPDVRIELMGPEEYAALERKHGESVPNWEFPAKRQRDMLGEKIDKAMEDLQEEGFQTVRLDGDPHFHLFAYNGDALHFVQVLYIRALEEKEGTLTDAYNRLAGVTVPDGNIHKELRVYLYGVRGSIRHII